MTDPSDAPKEWVLDPETEYRFELDPGTTLAITVRVLSTLLKIGRAHV